MEHSTNECNNLKEKIEELIQEENTHANSLLKLASLKKMKCWPLYLWNTYQSQAQQWQVMNCC